MSIHCATSLLLGSKPLALYVFPDNYNFLLHVEIEVKRVCLHQVEMTYLGNQSILIRIEL